MVGPGLREKASFTAGLAPDEGWALDAEYPRLKALLILRTGHHYYDDKDGLLWERLRRRFRATGLADAGAYLARLQDARLGEAEWAALEAEITIGETFFFRYAEQFLALRDAILPRLIARNQDSRRLRLWSAGCANGAEPYSLGILLRQILGEALPDWRIHLIGSDINEAVLETARRAQFGRWALRSLSPEALARDFVPDADGRSWTLRPQHRALVRFTRHNLLSLLDGSSPLQFSEFDLILCRNVLIYFHPRVVEQVVRALADRLVPGGWLLLGHAEPNPAFAEFLEVVSLPGTIAYRRPVVPLAAGTVPSPALPPSPTPPPPVAGLAAEPPWPAVAPAPEPQGIFLPGFVVPSWAPLPPSAFPPPRPAPPEAAAPGQDPLALRDAVRRLADQGDLAGAQALCQAALAAHPTQAALHFYAAMIARGLGRPGQAEPGFRRALYLDGGFVMAHYQLGLLLLDQGQREAGRRALATASRIAQSLPEDRVLEEGDGMTAGALRQGVRLQLDALAARGGG